MKLKKFLINLPLFVIVLWFSNAFAAATYYAATTGTTTNCTTMQNISTPASSIKAAIECANRSLSNTVIIRAGIYNEHFDYSRQPTGGWPKGTSWSSPATIKAHANESVTLRPTSGVNHINLSSSTGAHYLSIEGLTLDSTGQTYFISDVWGSDGGGVFGGSSGLTTHVRFRNNTFLPSTGTNVGGELHDWWFDGNTHISCGDTHGDHCFYIGGSNIVIENSTFRDTNGGHTASGGYAVQFYDASTADPTVSITIRNNIVRDSTHGLTLRGNTFNRVYNNVFARLSGDAVSIFGGNHGQSNGEEIYNNVFYQIGNDAVVMGQQAGNSSNYRVSNNIFSGVSGSLIHKVESQWPSAIQSHNLCFNIRNGSCSGTGARNSENPLFVNPVADNYSLQASSPAIDTGTTIINPSVSIPACGVSVLTYCYNGNAPDIGAKESGVSPTAGGEDPPTFTPNLASVGSTSQCSTAPPPAPSGLTLAVTSAIAPTPTSTSAGTTSGLLGYWKFDERTGSTACDSSGEGNTGSLVNGPLWAVGKIGGALYFDGIDDHVTVADSNSLDVANSFTLSAWVNPASSFTDFRSILVKNYKYYLYASTAGNCGSGSLLAGFDEQTSNTLCQATPLPANTWTHLAATYTGSVLTLYRNGVAVATSNITKTLSPTNGTLQIGASQFGENFKGLIDEVRVHNRSLTSTEVQGIFQQESAVRESGLVAHWKFDEGNGTTTSDSSGSGNAGILTNGPLWSDGRIGKGLSFDGIDDHVTVADSNSLDVANSFTLSAWVNPASSFTDFRSILVKNYKYYLYASTAGNCGSGSLLAGFDEQTSNTLCQATPLPANTWTHLAATYTGSVLTLYRNGVAVATSNITKTLSPTNGTLQIGASQFGENFKGLIDEVRVHNRALTNSEIQAIFQKEYGGV
jgi:hypothetical protein